VSFSINDKVVCVDDRNFNPRNLTPWGVVVKGSVYVVEGTVFINGTHGLLIVGKPCIDKYDGENVGWRAIRFRKLSEMKQEAADRQRKDQPCPH
jgi:hypothetical protein